MAQCTTSHEKERERNGLREGDGVNLGNCMARLRKTKRKGRMDERAL